jgi:hypothetical protein
MWRRSTASSLQISQPTKVSFGLENIQSCTCRGFSLALNNQGIVYGIGELVIASHSKAWAPKAIPNIPMIKTVSTGGDHSILLDTYDKLWTLQIQ